MSDHARSIKMEHFQNLVAVAFADGILDEEEEDILYEKADEFELPEDQVEELINNAEDLEFIVPLNMEDREDQLADIVFMAMIDGDLHEKEYKLCLSISERLGLDKDDLDLAIELTKKLWNED